MKIEKFLENIGGDFYTGVPDSQLKPLCDYLMKQYGTGKKHMIAANEGNAVGLAAGHYLATGKCPVVYVQNSGIGNIINPVASLLNDAVYAIPCIFVIGWRGEPGVHDEPQHIFQGRVTLPLLKDMEIESFVLDVTTTEIELEKTVAEFQKILAGGRSVAYVIKKGALTYSNNVEYENSYILKREEALERIVSCADNDIIISTTGKVSRELFELREKRREDHARDFLTVGSMGHSSSIALKIAMEKPEKRIWCVDGDGALLMHMGAMAHIGKYAPKNLVHVVMNNEAHETVGGMPTVAGNLDLMGIAENCGYSKMYRVEQGEELEKRLEEIKEKNELTFLEIKCAIGSRDDLGRPTTLPQENKCTFMQFLKK